MEKCHETINQLVFSTKLRYSKINMPWQYFNFIMCNPVAGLEES